MADLSIDYKNRLDRIAEMCDIYMSWYKGTSEEKTVKNFKHIKDISSGVSH